MEIPTMPLYVVMAERVKLNYRIFCDLVIHVHMRKYTLANMMIWFNLIQIELIIY